MVPESVWLLLRESLSDSVSGCRLVWRLVLPSARALQLARLLVRASRSVMLWVLGWR